MKLTATRILGLLLATATLVGCAGAGAAPAPYGVYRDRLRAIETRSFFQTITIVDRNGSLLALVAPEGYRTWIPLDEVPVLFREAVIATEDQTFYSNAGVDPSAMARAALQNAQAGETVSGASTITMQLVRLVAFGDGERYEQTLDRKLREAQLASDLSAVLSKDRILEAYINVAYFGHQAYGVEAAANIYFGVPARDLTLSQAALLAGLPQAPALLDPYENPTGALARRAVVLQRMVRVGYVSREAAAAAAEEPLELAGFTRPKGIAPHFVDYVTNRLDDLIGPDLAARGGFTVTTTVDLALNDALRDIAVAHVDELREAHDVGDAAVVAVRPGSGEILAMVGGTNYDEEGSGQVNVTVRARQPGSAIKPLVYASALEEGWTPASLLWDIPYEFPGANGEAYRPTNYDDRYRGPVSLRNALGNSLNAATIGLASDVGLDNLHATAASLGLKLGDDPNRFGLSFALGAAEVPLLDLTAAYAAFAAGGSYAEANPVLAVEAFRGGELLYVNAPNPRQAIDSETAFLISSILSDPEARRDAFGTGGPLNTSQPAAVKTGTSNDFRDNLTVGYTPYVAIGVWAGNKSGQPMRDVLGITGAAPIWHDSLERVFSDESLQRMLGNGQLPQAEFVQPEGVVAGKACRLATLTVDGTCQEYDEYLPEQADERATAFGWFRDQSDCSERLASGEGGGQIQLSPPRTASLATQVRGWAAGRGILVAAPTCGG